MTRLSPLAGHRGATPVLPVLRFVVPEYRRPPVGISGYIRPCYVTQMLMLKVYWLLDDLDSSVNRRKQGKDGEKFHSVAGEIMCVIYELTTRHWQDANLIASLYS